ncbi:hypothetical protein FB561_2119 [Kribbella amoyensis]|uniref:Uncharacterized protein n=1 Tax=Kribbella amoyensis TaxID=996641 RepID=A0A561BQ64_9ACTN|nr:hypothetical protein [Kribbella amoyensis]TWD81016.1 hypothetical protein FB561_2119 [Kribbella amoyensis]
MPTTTEPPSDASAFLPGFGRRFWFLKVAAETIWLLAALLVVLVFALAAASLSDYLPEVDPLAVPDRLTEAKALTSGWAKTLAVTSAALFALAGFPRLTGKRWWRAPGGPAGIALQGLGGLWAGFSTVGLHLSLADSYRAYPDGYQCAYLPSCWPEKAQAWSHSAPGLLAGIALVVMAVLYRAPWWVRALVPVAIWVGAVSLQYGVVAPSLVPYFEGPPR